MADEISSLTEQPVSITLGKNTYQAERLNMYNLGQYNRYREERTQKGETANLESDAMFYLLSLLIKPFTPNITPEAIAKGIPFADAKDIENALMAVGFTKPQTEEKQTVNQPTGEKSTQ
jgi:hypothetical protein